MNTPARPPLSPGKFLTLFTPLYWLAVLAAFFLSTRNWTILQSSSTDQERLFGLFGFCVFSVIVYFAYRQVREQRTMSLSQWIQIGMPALVGLFLLAMTIEFARKSWDYEQYERAFQAVAANGNPYDSTRYLYPPFFAQVMAAVYHVGSWIFPVLGLSGKDSSPWPFVFYIHQSAVLYSLLLAFELSVEFARRIGLSPLRAMLLVSMLFVFNVPVLRTMSFNQVNSYILVSILTTLLALERLPILSGLAIAAGGLIKLYPFVLMIPLLVTRKWKALLGVVLGVGIVLLSQVLLGGAGLWKKFILFYLSFPVERESSVFRNTSPLSFIRSTIELSGLPEAFVLPLFALASLAITVWYVRRFVQREAILRDSHAAARLDPETIRSFGHVIDFSVLSLLLAPSAWEHHYMIAIPLAIWAFALRGRLAPGSLILALTFVFFMPVFNVYPFSYLRMFGVILLLRLVSPRQSDA